MPIKPGSILAALLILLGIVAYGWRCQFCMETYDEPYYLAPGFHSMAAGDLPFVDEIHNAPRHYDILNYFLARPFLPHSVLGLRVAAVLVYSTVLLGYLLVCFSGRVNLAAGMVFLACLGFDFYLMPTWSHNWWLRNALLGHHLFFLLAWRKTSSEALWSTLAGIALGIMVMAYNPLLPLLIAAPLLMWTLRREMVFYYLAGALLPLGLDAWYLTSHGLWSPWVAAFRDVLAVPDYSGNTTPEKAWGIVKYLFSQATLPALVALPFLLYSSSLLTPLRLLAVAAIGGYFVYKTGIAAEVDLVKASFCAWLVAGIFVLGAKSFAGRTRKWQLPVAVSALVGVGVTMASHAGVHSVFWVVPSIVIPFAGVLDRLPLFGSRRNEEKWIARTGYATLVLFYATIAFGAARYQARACYRDVPVKDCTAKLTMPPYQGLYTNPVRAALFEKIYEALKGKKFAMVFPNLPGPFLFPGLRSSLDSTLVNFAFSTRLNWEAARKMLERKRFPEAIVFVKIEPWTWGVGKPNHLLSPVANPLFLYTNCVKQSTVVDLPEFEIYSVRSEKSEPCLRSLLSSKAFLASRRD